MGDWNPTTAELREGETTDSETHAQRNLENIRMGVESGDLSMDQLSEETRERLED